MTLEQRIKLEITYRSFLGDENINIEAIRAQCIAETASIARMVLERASWPSEDAKRAGTQ